jgi:hypothetical protein
MPNDLAKQEKYNDLEEFVQSLSETMTSPTCKLCNSSNRKAAEAEYERTSNASAAYRFLKDKGEDISNAAVSAHINNHYKKSQVHNNLKEFASDLAKWSQLSNDDELLYTRFVKMLNMEANLLQAENASLPLPERRRNTELILKIGQQITVFKTELKKLQVEKRPVEIFVDTLNRIIRVKMADAQNQETKKVLADLVDQLVREVEIIPDKFKDKEEA